MKIVPRGAPDAPSLPTAKTSSQMTPREKAIARIMGEVPREETVTRSDLSQMVDASQPETSSVETPEMGQNITSESVPPVEQAASSEVATPAEQPSTTPSEPISSHYAIIARKEKALRAKAQAQEAKLRALEADLKAKEEALKARESEYSSKYIPRDRISTDPLSVLSELGVTYDQLTQAALNAPSPQQAAQDAYLKKLEAKIAELESGQQKTLKTFEEQQLAARQQAENQMLYEVKSMVKDSPEFELINSTGSAKDVVKLISKTYDEDGILLSVDEAARQVESYLEDEAFKLSKLSKIQKRLQPAVASTTPKPQATSTKQPETKNQLKTLTNAVGTAAKLSARDRAILAMQGKLSKQ